jgi:hypothetical protein
MAVLLDLPEQDKLFFAVLDKIGCAGAPKGLSAPEIRQRFEKARFP